MRHEHLGIQYIWGLGNTKPSDRDQDLRSLEPFPQLWLLTDLHLWSSLRVAERSKIERKSRYFPRYCFCLAGYPKFWYIPHCNCLQSIMSVYPVDLCAFTSSLTVLDHPVNKGVQRSITLTRWLVWNLSQVYSRVFIQMLRKKTRINILVFRYLRTY